MVLFRQEVCLLIAHHTTRAHPNLLRPAIPPAVLVLAIAALALAGAVLAINMINNAPTEVTFVEIGQHAQAGGIDMSVETAEWISMDHNEAKGFPMPASMMPGMPGEGEHRLKVEFTLRNPGESARAFAPAELQLAAGGGKVYAPINDPAMAHSIGPGQAIDGLFYFDVPGTETDLHLVWTSGGTQVHIPLSAPSDEHHNG